MREGMSGADWVIHAAADLDFARARGADAGGQRRRGARTSPRSPTSWGCRASSRSPRSPTSAAARRTARRPPRRRRSSSRSRPLYSATKHAGEQAIRAWAQARAAGQHRLPEPGLRPAGEEGAAPTSSCGSSSRGAIPAAGRRATARRAGSTSTTWSTASSRVMEQAPRRAATTCMPATSPRCASLADRGLRPGRRRAAAPRAAARAGALRPHPRRAALPPARAAGRRSRRSSSTAWSATGPSTTPAPAPSSAGSRGRWTRGCRRRWSTCWRRRPASPRKILRGILSPSARIGTRFPTDIGQATLRWPARLRRADPSENGLDQPRPALEEPDQNLLRRVPRPHRSRIRPSPAGRGGHLPGQGGFHRLARRRPAGDGPRRQGAGGAERAAAAGARGDRDRLPLRHGPPALAVLHACSACVTRCRSCRSW